MKKASEILRKRGEDTRSHQNRLIFLAVERDQLLPLRDQTRRYLAWASICDAVDELNLDRHHQKQAEANKRKVSATLKRLLPDAYKHLFVPVQELEPAGGISDLFWEDEVLPSGEANFASAIKKVATEREWIITKWAPIHLSRFLKDLYWKGERGEVEVLKVWQDSAKYLYLPRLSRKVVFEETLTEGALHRDFFGVAADSDEEKGYIGLLFGRSGNVFLDSGALLVSPEAALRDEKRKAAKERERIAEEDSGQSEPEEVSKSEPLDDPEPGETTAKVTRFYAAVEVDPHGAGLSFADIEEAVIQPLLLKLGTNVTITVDIRANNRKGFDAGTQRTVKENAATLKFRSAGFEEE